MEGSHLVRPRVDPDSSVSGDRGEGAPKFNQLHDEDHGRIKYQRTCAIDGDEVTFEHIVKGYEYEKDKYVVLTDEDFDAVPVESSRAIEILQFVDLEEIDPIYYKKTYYLIPEEMGVKAYTLLREAMTETGRVGIAKVSFRDKEHLATLRFRDDVFLLETMFWPDEIRAADFDEIGESSKLKVRSQEVQMAESLIENLTSSFDPDRIQGRLPRGAPAGSSRRRSPARRSRSSPRPKRRRWWTSWRR